MTGLKVSQSDDGIASLVREPSPVSIRGRVAELRQRKRPVGRLVAELPLDELVVGATDQQLVGRRPVQGCDGADVGRNRVGCSSSSQRVSGYLRGSPPTG